MYEIETAFENSLNRGRNEVLAAWPNKTTPPNELKTSESTTNGCTRLTEGRDRTQPSITAWISPDVDSLSVIDVQGGFLPFLEFW